MKTLKTLLWDYIPYNHKAYILLEEAYFCAYFLVIGKRIFCAFSKTNIFYNINFFILDHSRPSKVLPVYIRDLHLSWYNLKSNSLCTCKFGNLLQSSWFFFDLKGPRIHMISFLSMCVCISDNNIYISFVIFIFYHSL